MDENKLCIKVVLFEEINNLIVDNFSFKII